MRIKLYLVPIFSLEIKSKFFLLIEWGSKNNIYSAETFPINDWIILASIASPNENLLSHLAPNKYKIVNILILTPSCWSICFTCNRINKSSIDAILVTTLIDLYLFQSVPCNTICFSLSG